MSYKLVFKEEAGIGEKRSGPIGVAVHKEALAGTRVRRSSGVMDATRQ